MRAIKETPDDVEEKKKKLKAKAEGARELASNATIQTVGSTQNTVALEIKPQAKNKGAGKPEVDILASILSDNKDSAYAKNSSEKKVMPIRLNHFEKAALFLVSKQQGVTMLAVLREYSINKIISIAEKEMKLTSQSVKELREKNLI